MWYVLHSCLIDLPPCNDPFILHCDDLDVFVEMLELIGYKIDERVKRQVKRMIVFITLRQMKIINKDTAECCIRASYQKAIYIDRSSVNDEVANKEFYMPFVFVDGKADEEQLNKILSILNPVFKELCVEEVIAINELVDYKKRIASVRIPIELKKIEMKIEENWNELKMN